MARIRERLKKVAEVLGLDQAALARARRRYKANRQRAERNHRKALEAVGLADECRDPSASPDPASARKYDEKAARCHHRAYKNHVRAQVWLGRIKAYVQRIHQLETTQADLEAERKKLNKVTIRGNRATGGSRRQRIKAVALASAAACASGKRPNFYSQVGTFDASHCITGPTYGYRDDCSSWFASVYKSAGLSDPSGQRFTAGWTGTLVEHGKQLDHPEVGCAVIYGPGSGHHVELYVGPGDKTIGHGSAPVDAGVVNLFGDGNYRFFAYV